MRPDCSADLPGAERRGKRGKTEKDGKRNTVSDAAGIIERKGTNSDDRRRTNVGGKTRADNVERQTPKKTGRIPAGVCQRKKRGPRGAKVAEHRWKECPDRNDGPNLPALQTDSDGTDPPVLRTGPKGPDRPDPPLLIPTTQLPVPNSRICPDLPGSADFGRPH